MKNILAFLLAAVAFGAPVLCQDQPMAKQQPLFPAEAAFSYTWIHTNAPPGGCGCFSLNGGSAEFVFPVSKPGFSVVANFTMGTQSNADSTGTGLLLSSYTGGVRYRIGSGVWQPFGEVLIGGAHASGTFATNSVANLPSFSFAAITGGGLDRRLNPRWSLRLVQADYFVTTFNNGTNNHQNNLRLSAGVVLHFGR